MPVRDQIITFLLQTVDQKDATIAELQKKVAELEKASQPAPTPAA